MRLPRPRSQRALPRKWTAPSGPHTLTSYRHSSAALRTTDDMEQDPNERERIGSLDRVHHPPSSSTTAQPISKSTSISSPATKSPR
ncbi:uncharacterized protein PADG_01273 [Paracoccidioides brasiliensis Pb18]|uniref:Uncharacterized protein n=1 Tax=Paracoccidioides brasiliensis (strain Pb18) TaxID=502780 RepID=C1G2V7_PARBD|nr:uncharacterized protein PADG_01273 [Paracoccidioides brasiliensis Pb18]EEH45123.1 hypothetical protein PADG_01273 [Paracoccidioides brasiliensis Pb18]